MVVDLKWKRERDGQTTLLASELKIDCLDPIFLFYSLFDYLKTGCWSPPPPHLVSFFLFSVYIASLCHFLLPTPWLNDLYPSQKSSSHYTTLPAIRPCGNFSYLLSLAMPIPQVSKMTALP